MRCPVCKKDGAPHPPCMTISKFRCMCGCNRKFNMNELNQLNRRTSDRIKCIRKKIQCNMCNHDALVLASYSSREYNGDAHVIYICYKCYKFEEKKINKLMLDISRKKENYQVELGKLNKIFGEMEFEYWSAVKQRQRKAFLKTFLKTCSRSNYNEYFKTDREDDDENIYQLGKEILNRIEGLLSLLKRETVEESEIQPIYNCFRDKKPFDVIILISMHMRRFGIPNGVIHSIILMYFDDLDMKISPYYRYKYHIHQ